ncbi:DUF6894 family protein [Allosphingosinicella sp.]|jgi:hypothetical protein|uniref:DUF6894 family protein n=1 Tax=Allosphingosinicella sp. TaxID=2823234 RepID=UPI003D7426B0
MPNFYFHLHDGKSRLEDRRGVCLPDAEAAWYQAFRNARDIVLVARVDQIPCRDQALEVEDERGIQVWTMPLAEVAEMVG